jgi:general stress protein 26
MNEKIIANAEEIIKSKTTDPSNNFCTLALINENGYPTASTVSIARADGLKTLSFGASLDDNKARRVSKNNRASVCVNSPDFNITLVGTIEILTEPIIKKETWCNGWENHWSGADDPNYCVLRFTTERYNLFVGYKSAEGAV